MLQGPGKGPIAACYTNKSANDDDGRTATHSPSKLQRKPREVRAARRAKPEPRERAVPLAFPHVPTNNFPSIILGGVIPFHGPPLRIGNLVHNVTNSANKNQVYAAVN